MAATDLVDLAEAKRYLGITGTTDDTLIQEILSGVSLDIKNACQAPLVRETGLIEYHEGGKKRIFLRAYPVVSITSIQDSKTPTPNEVPATDYFVRKDIGLLEHFGRFPIPVNNNGQRTVWTVTFEAGRFANTAAVPADLKLVANKMIARAWGRKEPGDESVSVGSLSITYASLKDWELVPPEVMTTLGQYMCNRTP